MLGSADSETAVIFHRLKLACNSTIQFGIKHHSF